MIQTSGDWLTSIWHLASGPLSSPIFVGMLRSFSSRRTGRPWPLSSMRMESRDFISSMSLRIVSTIFSPFPAGIISDLKWHSDSADLVFNFRSSHAASDVYSVNVETGKVDLWAKSITNGIDTSKFPEPELIHWTTFDKRILSGFLYRPPLKFTGKRPVIIDIHGGPEEQFRPGFGYDDAYFVKRFRYCQNLSETSVVIWLWQSVFTLGRRAEAE